MKTLITFSLLLTTTIANAQCYGNSTDVQGYNNETGSRWNQHSDTYGDTTYQSGTAANGNRWNSTTQQIGDYQYRSGTNSRGEYFNQTCGPYGCN